MSELTLDMKRKIADLRIQAMLFGLEVDWETLALVPKSDYVAPPWVTAWKIKQEEADFDVCFDLDRM